MLATLIKPDRGDAYIDGCSIVSQPDGVRGKIGFLTSELKLEEFFTPSYLFDFFSELHQVPHEVRESARGVGMSGWQQFFAVDVPLALPVWLAGLRVVVVQTLGMAVVAALIGAGGFGALVFQGLLSSALDLVLLGVVPTIALAVVVDALFALWLALLGRRAND